MLASLRRSISTKRKEREVKNSDRSAFILVRHRLESNFAPKRSPVARLCHIFMLLRLRMSPYAYAYRKCKHPCSYACACVVRVNQALAYENLKKAYKNAEKRSKNFKPSIHNVITGTNVAKNMAFSVPIGSVKLERYCGKMYRRPLLRIAG